MAKRIRPQIPGEDLLDEKEIAVGDIERNAVDHRRGAESFRNIL